VFIPKCTKDIFTKSYSIIENDSNYKYFTASDMQSYLNHIAFQLKPYLSNEQL
jgi:hypothetical protein